MSMSYEQIDLTVERTRRKVWFLLFMKQWIQYSVAALLSAGIILLISRVVLSINSSLSLQWWHSIAALCLTTLAAAVLAFRQSSKAIPDCRQFRAVLDRLYTAGGLLIAAESRGVDSWLSHVPSLTTPSFSFTWLRQSSALLLTLIFFICCVSFPLPSSSTKVLSHNPINEELLKAMQQRVNDAETQGLIRPEISRKLIKDIQKLRTQKSDHAAAGMWNVMDALDSSFRNELDISADALRDTQSQLEFMESLVQAISLRLKETNSDEEREKLRKALEAAMKEYQQMFPTELAKRLSKHNLPDKTLSLTDSDIKKIQKAIANKKKDVEHALKKVQQFKEYPLWQLEKIETDNKNVALYLARNTKTGEVRLIARVKNKEGLEELKKMAKELGLKLKSGSNKEGPGSMPLLWQKTDKRDDFRYQDMVIGRANISDSPGQITGIRLRNPEREHITATDDGATSRVTTDSRNAFYSEKEVSYRHSKAVEEYFAVDKSP